jgi:hypothetical protein
LTELVLGGLATLLVGGQSALRLSGATELPELLGGGQSPPLVDGLAASLLDGLTVRVSVRFGGVHPLARAEAAPGAFESKRGGSVGFLT